MLLKSLLHVTRDEEIGFGWKKAKGHIRAQSSDSRRMLQSGLA